MVCPISSRGQIMSTIWFSYLPKAKSILEAMFFIITLPFHPKIQIHILREPQKFCPSSTFYFSGILGKFLWPLQNIGTLVWIHEVSWTTLSYDLKIPRFSFVYMFSSALEPFSKVGSLLHSWRLINPIVCFMNLRPLTEFQTLLTGLNWRIHRRKITRFFFHYLSA